MDGGAWWAAVHGVAESQTRLKQLGSSNQLSQAVFAFPVTVQPQDGHRALYNAPRQSKKEPSL